MTGKRIKVTHGLYAGCEAEITSEFKHNGEQLYAIKVRKQESDGEIFYCRGTVNASEFEVL